MTRRVFLGVSLSPAAGRAGSSHRVFNDALPALMASQAVAAKAFQSAQPVWPRGRETDKNIFAGFRAVFHAPAGDSVRLRIAASTLYRAYVNGKFQAWGPARGPHGFYRVDDFDITGSLSPGRNVVAIEVAGYNVNSYWVINQPSFLEAELVSGAGVLASTGGAGIQFEAAVLSERVQKVQRYSFQRAFSEVYRLGPMSDRWKTDPGTPFAALPLTSLPQKSLILRRVPYPDFALRQPVKVVSTGTFGVNPKAKPWRDRSLTAIGPQLLGFREDELEVTPAVQARQIENAQVETLDQAYSWDAPLPLIANRFCLFDFGTNLSGFPGARVVARKPTRLFLTFDEMLVKGDVEFTRLAALNLITYDLQPGVYGVESFEPYTLRFLKAMVVEGECEIDRVCLREYANPDVWRAHFASSDEGLNRLFAAGRETYRQNAVDAFTDCPHRERAGWLCDSYFTARVEPLLSGHSKVEKTFLENFQLPARFEPLPEGMLPMCYPADHYDGQYIPNWSLWFVLQLEEYLERSGDRELVVALRPRVMKLLEYFKPLRNQDGLLEKLPGWVFVEWSAANKYVQDVNYPTNMLYAAALAAAGRMCNLSELTRSAGDIRNAIRKQSFDGEFFVDNAVRQNGKLAVTRNRTETCQYYAFYLGAATPESHPQLWKVLRDDFGPERKSKGLHPEIHEANAFIGNVLRLELLSRAGLTRQLIQESRAYLLYMADRTGTLWEHQDERASLDHGFASHVVNVLYRDGLGLRRIDRGNQTVEVSFFDSGLDWCQGSVPVEGGQIALRWKKENGILSYHIDTPAGYGSRIENHTGYVLRQEPVADAGK